MWNVLSWASKLHLLLISAEAPSQSLQLNCTGCSTFSEVCGTWGVFSFRTASIRMFVPISLVTLCHYGYRIFVLTGLPGTELQRKCVQCGNRTCSFGTFWHILAHCGILQDFRCSTHRCSRTAAAPLTASGGAMGRHGAPWGAMGRHGQGPVGSDTEADTPFRQSCFFF